MTLRIFRGFLTVLIGSMGTSFMVSLSVQAGLEIIGQPPLVKKRGGGENSVGTRVQVFGSGKVKTVAESAPAIPEEEEDLSAEVSAADYAEMMKNDAGRGDETEFESLRNRMRTRKVAQAPSDTLSTEKAAPATRPPPSSRARTRPMPRASVVTSGATARPPVRPMETEVITPQGAQRGTKVPSARPAREESAMEPESSMDAGGGSDETNAAFPYTHLLPSPFNLSQGSWVIGSSAAYGIFDFLQVSTNVVRTLNEQWNFQAKVPLIEFPTFMATAFVDYESFNPRNISNLNPDYRFKRWQPGLVTAYEITPDMAFFLGGNFSFGDDPFPVVRTSGYLKGARIEADWSWLYNPQSSRLANNALSAGVTYDTTYSMLGFGVTHHWRSFSAGVHYTFADESRFLPIFGFSVGASF